MTWTEAIDVRKSRRTYTGPVPEREAGPLGKLCKSLSKEYGIFLELVPRGAGRIFGGFAKTYGLFKDVQALVCLGVYEKTNDAFEKIGHAGEKVVLEATTKGLGTCWVGGTFDQSAVQTVAPDGVEIVAVLTIGAVPAEESGKEKFFRNMMHRKSKTAAEMSTVEGEAPEWFAAGVEAAVKAPSAVNAQPVTFAWERGAATASVPGERSMQYIDLGIAKLHFELGAGNGRFASGNGGAYRLDA